MYKRQHHLRHPVSHGTATVGEDEFEHRSLQHTRVVFQLKDYFEKTVVNAFTPKKYWWLKFQHYKHQNLISSVCVSNKQT